jgi:hypothetical protein
MVLMSWDRGSPGMRHLVLTGVLAFVAGLALGAGLEPAGPAAAVILPAQAEPERASNERLLTVAPGQAIDLAIRATGEPLEVHVRMFDGASVDGLLYGPADCGIVGFSTNVIALSTSGQTILDARCGPVPAGDHVLRIETAASAYLASIRLANATFPA